MTPISPDADGNDPYAVPKSRGMFTVIHTINNLTSGKIIQNIIMNRYVVTLTLSQLKEKNFFGLPYLLQVYIIKLNMGSQLSG